ncbi:MAG: trehalose-6-phosphate synthase [Thermoleophilia bacterium]|nr:trehalose-6-phosphate synthase [Thermoleophilia bacterium]
MPQGGRRLIVVSNRGPVSFRREGGELVTGRGAGGLVTALSGLLAHQDVTWIASAMTPEDREVGSHEEVRFVAHDERAYHGFYDVVSNPALWFVQHGLSPVPAEGLEEAWDEGYAVVNRAFADAVLAELDADPGATVFFQDYHLYLAPRYVREARPDALLAHFVHIPWPEPSAWRQLPGRLATAVHDGLLANDVVGFHADRWRQSFLRSTGEILGRGPGAVLVTAHPISVDADEFEELAGSEAVLAAERAIVARRPERLVVRVDRTDPSKNVVRGLRAFELYLERHPDAHGRVGMLALLNPSRLEIPVYAEYLAEIERTAAAVEERFPGAVDVRVNDDFAEAVAGYRQFDVLLVNSVMDGLNLVAKEAPLANERNGVVVLSDNTGAVEELGEWVVRVDPFDVSGQADAIHEALELAPAERRRRLEAIRAHVREHDVAAWADRQLADFDRVAAAARR